MLVDDAERRGTDVARIDAQMFIASLLWRRALDHDGTEHCLQLADIMTVCSGHDDRERDAKRVHQKSLLLPFFSPVCRVGSDSFLCKGRFHQRAIDALPAPCDALQIVVLCKADFP